MQKAKAPGKIERIYRYMLERGDYGATDDEIKRDLKMLASTAGARRRDLETMGGCIKTRIRRQTMNGGTGTVHVAVPGATLTKKKIGRPKKDKTYSEKVMTYLRADTYEYVSNVSRATDSSVAAIVRTAVNEYVASRRLAVRKEMDILADMNDLLNDAEARHNTTGGSDAESI